MRIHPNNCDNRIKGADLGGEAIQVADQVGIGIGPQVAYPSGLQSSNLCLLL